MGHITRRLRQRRVLGRSSLGQHHPHNNTYGAKGPGGGLFAEGDDPRCDWLVSIDDFGHVGGIGERQGQSVRRHFGEQAVTQRTNEFGCCILEKPVGDVDIGSDDFDLAADGLDEVFAVVNHEFEVEGFFAAARIAGAGPDQPCGRAAIDKILIALPDQIQHWRSPWGDVVRSDSERRISLKLDDVERRVDHRGDSLKEARHHCVRIRNLTVSESIVLVSQTHAVQEAGVTGDIGEQDRAYVTTLSQRFVDRTHLPDGAVTLPTHNNYPHIINQALMRAAFLRFITGFRLLTTSGCDATDLSDVISHRE